MIGRVSSKEILVLFVSLWAFGNATLLNPYTYNKDKRGVCFFLYVFIFYFLFFSLSLLLNVLPTSSHLVPLLDEKFVDYLCFFFCRGARLLASKLNQCWHFQSHMYFFDHWKSQFCLSNQQLQNTKTTISRFRIGFHFEMQQLYAFK
jgi:hypothetical protein